MTGSISFHMLPAGDGDCLLVQALDGDGAVTTTILVDGGREETYPAWKPIVQGLLGPRGNIDLVVVTHIDADHIGGVLVMLADKDRGFGIGGIWFNGYPQVLAVQPPDQNREGFGVAQADSLSGLVAELAIPWNEAFSGGPIHSGIEAPGLRVGDFSVTIVTPCQQKLAAMAGPWARAWEDARRRLEALPREGLERLGNRPPNVEELAASGDESDTAKPNGSSIGLVLEAFGRRLLLAGDCHPGDLATALAAHTGTSTRVDLLKVSHHGARKNTTKAMLGTISASIYAFSTDGSRHDHPDDQSVAKIILSGDADMLAFNYRTALTEKWGDERLTGRFGYETRYPVGESLGYLRIDLPGI